MKFIVVLFILVVIGSGLFIIVMSQAPQNPNYTANPSVTPQITPNPTTSAEIKAGTAKPSPLSKSTSVPMTSSDKYPVHRAITATVFWVGEPVGNGSTEDNSLSAWDDNWKEHFGGFDDPFNRNGYYPSGFVPKENPFYLDLPYSDFDDNGDRKQNAFQVVPWAKEKAWGNNESMMKNRWVKLSKNGIVCYGQIEDAGPYEYDDTNYVFGSAPPKNKVANSAGMDVSPAIRDCLKFEGANNAQNKVDWQFIDERNVPDGPWKKIITRSQVSWK